MSSSKSRRLEVLRVLRERSERLFRRIFIAQTPTSTFIRPELDNTNMAGRSMKPASRLCSGCGKPLASCLCACLSIVSFKPAKATHKSTPKPGHLSVNKPLKTPSDLVVLWENSLHRWDLLRKTWNTIALTVPVQADTESRWMWVQDWLFCSGGDLSLGRGQDGSGIRSAYSVGASGKVRSLVDMSTQRGCHGLWWNRASKVFVFGGNCPVRPQ